MTKSHLTSGLALLAACTLLSSCSHVPEVGGRSQIELEQAQYNGNVCITMATAFGFSTNDYYEVQRPTGRYFLTKEWSCKLDENNQVLMFEDLKGRSTSFPYDDPSDLTTREETRQIADDLLAKLGMSFSDNVTFKDPWDDMRPLVVYRDEPEIEGYPTEGYVGGLDIVVHRVIGKVILFDYQPSRPAKPPVVNIDKEQAIREADQALRDAGRPTEGLITRAGLQYYFPPENGATVAGTAVRNKGKAVLVYTVSFVSLSKPDHVVWIVSVDADTGLVLDLP